MIYISVQFTGTWTLSSVPVKSVEKLKRLCIGLKNPSTTVSLMILKKNVCRAEMWQAEEAHTGRHTLQNLPVHNTIVVQQHYFSD